MTEPGYVPPPVVGWWPKRNNNLVITAGLTAAGRIGAIAQSTATAVTVGRTATGNLGFQDNFNRADDASSIGTNWTNRLNTMGIQSNEAYPASGTFQFATLNSPVTSNDRRVSATAGAKIGAGANDDFTLFCAADTVGASVLANFDNQTSVFSIQTRGTWGGLANTRASVSSISYNDGDLLSIERVGTVYTVKQNGGTVGLSWNDSGGIVPIDSSHQLVGIGSSISGSYCRIDSFVAEYL